MVRTVLIALIFIISLPVFSQRGNFSVEVFGGSSIYLFDEIDNPKLSQGFNYSVGFYIKRNIVINKFILAIQSGYYVETKKYTRDYSSTLDWQPKQVFSEFTYGKLPVIVEANFNINGKFFPFICAGYILGTVLNEKQTIFLNNGDVTFDLPSQYHLEQNPHHIYLGIGNEIRINRILLAKLEAFYSQQLNGKSTFNRDVFGQIIVGVKLGLIFDFVFRNN